jgi:hypothetical protein
VLGGEHRAGAPEAGGDLIQHQQQAVLVAHASEQGHALGRVKAHPAGSLHDRLDDHSGELVRVRPGQLAQLSRPALVQAR